MQISIIIPIYKVEKYIERCIKSIIVQTFTDYEIILVDDASPDKALRLAENLLIENHIKFQAIRLPENRGLSEARNNGIKIAKGKYLMFIDSDDTLADNNVLEKFYTSIEREKVDFVSANYNIIDSENKVAKNPYVKPSETKKLEGADLLRALTYSELPVTVWNKLINKNFLEREKLYFKKGILLEDQLWSFELCTSIGTCYSLNSYTYNYYLNNPNAITFNINEKFISDYCFVVQEIIHQINKKRIITRENINDLTFLIREKSTNLLGICANSLDKSIWIEQYTKIQKSYKNSNLYTYKKQLTLPAKLAYFVFSERIKPYSFPGSKYYLKLVDLVNRYNWEGKV